HREAVGPGKREAELVLAKRRAAIREGKFFDVKAESNLTFGVLCARYLREHAALQKKPRSCLRNAAAIKTLLPFFGAETLLKHIQTNDVQQYIVQRTEAGRQPNTVNIELICLSAMFTWAQKLKLTANHPVRGISLLKSKAKDRWLQHEEIHRLLAAPIDLTDM